MIGLLKNRVTINDQCIDVLVREVKTDVGFRDYFNKFCCLPIFGQRVAFRLSGKQLLLDPSPVESTQRLNTISQDLILRWLMSRRFDLFNRSRVGCEYRLFLHLKEKVFSDSRLEGLKKKHLKRVTHMSSFLRYIHKSTQEGIIVDFWVDVERMKQEQMLAMRLRAIQAKYFMKSSPFCLPSSILEMVFPSKTKNVIAVLDYDQTVRLSGLVLKRLHSHWLVRYITLNENNPSQKPNMESRKLAAMEIRKNEIRKTQNPLLGTKWADCVDRNTVPPAVDVVLTGDQIIQKPESKSIIKTPSQSSQRSEEKYDLFTPSMALMPVCQNCDPVCAPCTENFQLPARLSSIDEGRSSSRISSGSEQLVQRNRSDDSNVDHEEKACSGSSKSKIPEQEDKVEDMTLVETVQAYFDDVFTRLEKEKESTAQTSAQKQCVTSPPKEVCSQGNLLCKMVTSEKTQRSFGIEEQFSMDNILHGARSDTGSKLFERLVSSGLVGRKPQYPMAKTAINWKFASVLASDEVSAFPFRVYLLTEKSKPRTSLGGSGYSAKMTKSANVLALDLWREIEGLRASYFVCEALELKRRTRNINERLIAFKSMKTHTSKLVQSIITRTEYPFPLRLIIIQLKLEETLKPLWITFASSEQFEFKRVIVKAARLGQRAVAQGPMSSASDSLLPKLQHLIRVTSDLKPPQVHSLEEVSSLFRRCHKEAKDMKYRTARAFCLTMPSVGHSVTSDFTNELHNIDDISSDEEGDIPPATPPRPSKLLPKLDPAQIALHSAKQYPIPGVKNPTLTTWEYDKTSCCYAPIHCEEQTSFIRPFTYNGMLVRRPSHRPSSFKEILNDPIHFEFLRRFLKSMGGDTPLSFLEEIYNLSGITSAKNKRSAMKNIFNKYFKSVADPCELLQCYASAIHEVTLAKIVTPNMLYLIARHVEESLEKNWGAQYMASFKTYTAPLPDQPLSTKSSEVISETTPARKGRALRSFQDFVRKTARFLKEMSKMDTYNDFRKYLTKTCKSLVVTSIKRESSSAETVNLDDEDPASNASNTKEKKMKFRLRYTRREVCGRKIILQFLPNDLDLLLESHRFLQIFDNMIFIFHSGCFEERDGVDVHKKLMMINRCYFESKVAPKTRVNLPRGLSEWISASIHSTHYGRSILFRAVLNLLPIILHFWGKYCLEKYAYVSNRELRARRHSGAQERRMKKKEQDELRIEKLRRKLKGEDSLPSLSDQPSTVESVSEGPDYINGWPGKGVNPWSKEMGIEYRGTTTTLTFSLGQGLKLVHEPPAINNRRSVPARPTYTNTINTMENIMKQRRHTLPSSFYRLPSLNAL